MILVARSFELVFLAHYGWLGTRFALHFLFSDRLHPQISSRDVEIGHCHKAEHLRRIFGQAPVARLAIVELAFDDAKNVLDLGPHGSVFFVTFLL